MTRPGGLAEALFAQAARSPLTDAATALLHDGLPTPSVEQFKYTNLRALNEAAYARPLPSTDVVVLPPGACVLTVNGCLRADLRPLPPYVVAAGLAGVDPLATLPLRAVNALASPGGAAVHVPENTDAGTLNLLSLCHTTEPGISAPRHTIRLDAGARALVIEASRGTGPYLHAPALDVTLAAGAHLTHIRVVEDSLDAHHLATVSVRVDQDATYDGFVLHAGGKLARTELHVHLAGERATAHLNGAQLLSGARLGDITTVVHHDAPNGASRQTVKSVLADRSRAVFQGRIEVARVAQKTDGYQMNSALLLSREAETDSKPELRIYADDVKCSHGATVGELDAAQLFYLRSRGIPEAEARALLVRAFLADALDLVTDDAARHVLEQAIEAAWQTIGTQR